RRRRGLRAHHRARPPPRAAQPRGQAGLGRRDADGDGPRPVGRDAGPRGGAPLRRRARGEGDRRRRAADVTARVALLIGTALAAASCTKGERAEAPPAAAPTPAAKATATPPAGGPVAALLGALLGPTPLLDD